MFSRSADEAASNAVLYLQDVVADSQAIVREHLEKLAGQGAPGSCQGGPPSRAVDPDSSL